MGDVYVLRKSVGLQLQSAPLPGGMNLVQNVGSSSGDASYLPGQSQMSQMTQTPEDSYGKFQYQAPALDKQGTRRLADVYGTTGMNQRIELGEKIRDAAPDSEEGFRNAMAQQKVFETAGQAGEAAHNKRDADATALGILAGAIGLANAGAAGADALTGMMGAAGQYQGASQLVQGTSRGAGERAARRAANKVGVTQPQVAQPTPQVAPPTRKPVMVEGLTDGSQVPINSEEARNRASRDTYNPSDAAQALGHYGADAEGKLQQTQQQAMNLIGVTGNPLQMPSSPTPIKDGQPYLRLTNLEGEPMQPPPATASPTPEPPQMSDKKVGSIIANNTTGNNEEAELNSDAGNTIQQSLESAKAGQEKAANASMASASSTNKKDDQRKMLVGVV